MDFSKYQELSKKYDLLEQDGDILSPGFAAVILGLPGEAGEVCEKFKKIVRDKGGKVSDEDRVAISKELGDVLWYVAQIARYSGLSLQEIAEENLSKLESRLQRNKLAGSGDES